MLLKKFRCETLYSINFLFRSGNASFSFGMEMSGPAFKRSTFEVNLENRDRDEKEQLLQGLGVQ